MQAIEQFRARYPQGGLISEFLTQEGGNYLVKVTVQADETVLATGLAAAEAIEVAEDRARQRALAAVGIGSPEVSSAPAAPVPEAIAPTTPYTSAFPDLDLPDPVASPTSPASSNGSHGSNGTGLGDNPQPSIWEARAAATVVETAAAPPAIDTTKPKAAKKRATKTKKSEPAPEPVAAPIPTPTNEPTLPALDASEVVTRAKAELKRLGWTREQGQKFLLTRYGKRETRQLDDREWRDFYDYLYQQPNPAQVVDAS
ncbi:MAG: hypothetical protein AAFY11_11485 [Cyanobacteria bacterium J06641_5]